jgi:hypothetical protein
MRKKGENNIKPPRVKLRSARLNNDFTLGIESQTLLGLVASDIKHSDGVEDFYTALYQ